MFPNWGAAQPWNCCCPRPSTKPSASDPISHAARIVLQSVGRADSLYVFPGRNGEQRKEYRKIAERVKRRAGLPDDFRPLHGLRHAYASLLASSGKVDLYTLQKLLTHSSPQMTQRYAHLADEAMAYSDQHSSQNDKVGSFRNKRKRFVDLASERNRENRVMSIFDSHGSQTLKGVFSTP